MFVKNNGVAGFIDLYSVQNGGVIPMKNHFDFEDIMTFGLFLLILLLFLSVKPFVHIGHNMDCCFFCLYHKHSTLFD